MCSSLFCTAHRYWSPCIANTYRIYFPLDLLTLQTVRLHCTEKNYINSRDVIVKTGINCFLSFCYMHKELFRQNAQISTCSRVLLENLIVAHLVNKFLFFYGIWRLIAVFTKSNNSTLFFSSLAQSQSHHVSLHTNFNNILHLYLDHPSDLFPWGYPIKILHAFLTSFMCPICFSYLCYPSSVIALITSPHRVTTQKTNIDIFTAVRTSNLTY
jgi:hypothetical protein